jgi:hypothetical protein
LATPEDHPSFGDDSFTINTYSTKHKISRDPTMYIPGQEDRPDPYSESGWSDDGPPFKSKRDPTMYLDGESYDGDVPFKPTRDPTMYVDGHRETEMFDDSTAEEVHNDYHGVDKHYGKVTRDPSYFDMASNDSSYDDALQRFDDESRSIKSVRSKVSTRSKKSTKGDRRHMLNESTKGISEGMHKSSQSADWNASSGNDMNIIYEPKKRASLRASLVSNYHDSYNSSATDGQANSYVGGGAHDGVKDTRQTKSFYR